MAQGMQGADVEAMRATAGRMKDGAQVMRAADATVTGRFAALEWHGPDAARARQQWEASHGPALRQVAGALDRAAQALETQAAEQEAVSGTGGGAAPAAAAGADSPLWAAAKETADRLDLLGKAVDATTFVAARSRWVNALDELPDAARAFDAMGGAMLGPVTSGVMSTLGVVGTVMDGAKAVEAVREGDLAEAVSNGVAAGFGAVGVAGAGAVGAAGGLAWAGGWQIGTAINAGMEGTDYGRNFDERMAENFEEHGAWGMLATPVELIGAAYDTVVDELADGD